MLESWTQEESVSLLVSGVDRTLNLRVGKGVLFREVSSQFRSVLMSSPYFILLSTSCHDTWVGKGVLFREVLVQGCILIEEFSLPSLLHSALYFMPPASGEDPLTSPPLRSKSDMFPKSTEDDPVSQAIAKMIEPEDEVIVMSYTSFFTRYVHVYKNVHAHVLPCTCICGAQFFCLRVHKLTFLSVTDTYTSPCS